MNNWNSSIKNTIAVSFLAGEFDNCKTFIRIPEEDQNRDPKTLKNVTSRPLGFDSATIPFNDPNKPDPCFIVHLNDSKLQSIHVMVGIA